MAFARLQNFTAAMRLRLLVPFGLFSPNDNLGFIDSINTAQALTLSPTPNGINSAFTISSSNVPSGVFPTDVKILRNGVMQLPGTHYTITPGSNIITFPAGFTPQSDDYYQVIFG